MEIKNMSKNGLEIALSKEEAGLIYASLTTESPGKTEEKIRDALFLNKEAKGILSKDADTYWIYKAFKNYLEHIGWIV